VRSSIGDSSDKTPSSPANLVQTLHDAPRQIVLALSGGGSPAVGQLLTVSGASRTVLEIDVPYCEAAMTAWLGGRPEEFCTPQTARAMAMAAFRRACEYTRAAANVAGVACTAALATDRPKRGEHRVHLAVQDASRTATWSLTLAKGRRSRADEESLVSRLALNVVAEACGIASRLDLELLDDERVERAETIAEPAWQDLLLGKVDSIIQGPESTALVFPGAFNPRHTGHRRMAQIARKELGVPVAMELAIENVDKPPLDYHEIARRLGQFTADETVWLTRAATFEKKSQLFPNATFLVGADTIRRIAEPRYYSNDPAARDAALHHIAVRGCRFLVFGRQRAGQFETLDDLDLPLSLRQICDEIPAERFRDDVSSTEIRRLGEW